MSYYLYSKEEFFISNVNEDTAAFTLSVKRYIQDFLKGVRIQSIMNFEMELTVDEKLIIGEYASDDKGEGVIYLKSIQLDEEGMNRLLENLESHKNIHLRLNYTGFFFYFYHYGINRFAELLNKSLKGYVTFMASEEQEDELRAYHFREHDGELISGFMNDQDYRNYRHITDWKIYQLYFDLVLEEPISWETYYKVEKEAYKIGAKYSLKVEYEAYPSFVEGAPMADPGEVIFDRPHIEGTYEHEKETMTMQEMENFFVDVSVIYDILRNHVSMFSEQIKLKPFNTKEGEAILRMRIDEEKNLVLSVFDPDAKNIDYTPYVGDINRVKSMEELFKDWDVQIPFPEETLE